MTNKEIMESLGVKRGLIIHSNPLFRILIGRKTWEMRSRRININERIALIRQGHCLIYGTVHLCGCGDELRKEDYISKYENHMVDDFELLKIWKYPWLLTDVERLDEPIPYTHPTGAQSWVIFDR